MDKPCTCDGIEFFETDNESASLGYDVIRNKIIIPKNIRKRLTDDEFLAVLRHEARHKSRRKLSAGIGSGILIAGVINYYTLPLSLPFSVYWMRREEKECDYSSIKAGSSLDLLFSAREKIYAKDSKFKRLLYSITHPSKEKVKAYLIKKGVRLSQSSGSTP